jgi:hypothetical protein
VVAWKEVRVVLWCFGSLGCWADNDSGRTAGQETGDYKELFVQKEPFIFNIELFLFNTICLLALSAPSASYQKPFISINKATKR